MRIVAIDQASRSGWAAGSERSSERYKFGSFRMPKRDDVGERLVVFRDCLEEVLDVERPDLVAYEEPHFPLSAPNTKGQADQAKGIRFNPKTIQFLFMIKGVLTEVTARKGIQTESFPSSTWRVTALGMGRLPPGSPDGEFKRMMIRKAKSLGYDVRDDNEADSIGMLMHMLYGAPAAKRAQGDLLARETERL